MKTYQIFFPNGQWAQLKADAVIFTATFLKFTTGGLVTAEFSTTAIAGYREL